MREQFSFAIFRLCQAPDLAALEKVWWSLTQEQRLDPKVTEYKNMLKGQLIRERKR